MTPSDIRSLRAALDLKQWEMAARLGITPRHYRRLESEGGPTVSRAPSGSALVILRGMQVEAEARRERARATATASSARTAWKADL